VHGRTGRGLEQAGGEARIGRAQLAGAVGRHRAVQPDHGVDVDEAARLVFGDLRERDADGLAQPLLRQSACLRELARHVDRRAPPELAEQVVPQHRRVVVEALRADRLAVPFVISVMDDVAADPSPVRAHRRVASRQASANLAGRVGAVRVHRSEAGRGEGHEDSRVLCDGLGDAFAAL
jgi:hypothetical protein